VIPKVKTLRSTQINSIVHNKKGEKILLIIIELSLLSKSKDKTTKLFGSIPVVICTQYKFKLTIYKWGNHIENIRYAMSVLTEKFARKCGGVLTLETPL
jgi:hypothetical protein